MGVVLWGLLGYWRVTRQINEECRLADEELGVEGAEGTGDLAVIVPLRRP